MDDPEDDPWNTPDMHKGHNHSKSNGINTTQPPAPSNGYVPASPSRTSDALTDSYISTASASIHETHSQPASTAAPTGAWGFGDAPGAAIPDPFGGDGPARAPVIAPQRAPAPRVVSGRTGGSIEENILVTLMPGKEGLFMFQHHNYEITSIRRSSKVVRRYSDFVWLLDCLQKRYPFRVLPLLPPKRVAVNGNHLSNDGGFIEKRRRGLARFLNALARHPVLGQEQLVIMFLTVPTVRIWATYYYEIILTN